MTFSMTWAPKKAAFSLFANEKFGNAVISCHKSTPPLGQGQCLSFSDRGWYIFWEFEIVRMIKCGIRVTDCFSNNPKFQ